MSGEIETKMTAISTTVGLIVDKLQANTTAVATDLSTNYYTKTEVDGIVAPKIGFEVVAQLPAKAEAKTTVIYLVKNAASTVEHNFYDEYIFVKPEGEEGEFELIGTTALDLSKYYTKDEVNAELAKKVDKNEAIVGATKCKITYDSKGLVTAGADLEEADLPAIHVAKITDITATAAEINVLDGIEASTAELNFVKGVTSGIQAQLNGKQANLSEAQLAACDSGITETKRAGYDAHVADGDIHVTAEQKEAWTGKQDALDQAQMDAVNSGITAEKVAKYDAFDEGKVDANEAIEGATKCKITYDAKGLVTGGADLVEGDLPAIHLAKVTDVTASVAEVNQLAGAGAVKADFEKLHAVTATAAELNIMDGVTATTAEINVLDGIEASTAELNFVKGVTAGIQGQLDGKQGNLSEDQMAAVNSGITEEKRIGYDALDGAKADKATTLAGYGITDAYTITEVDTALGNLNTQLTAIYNKLVG